MAKGKKSKLRSITVDEALKVVGLSDANISPDGNQVAFVRSVFRKKEKTRGTSVWTVPAHGGKAKRLTQGPDDGQPRWSPDGATLAFTRKVDKGKPRQVFLLPVDGGEPEKLTDIDMGPKALKFVPTGKRISFLATTPDDKKTKKHKEQGDDARVFVKDDKPKRLWTASVKSGKAKPCSPDDLAVWEYDWLPGGKSAVVIYTDEPRVDTLYFHSQIGILEAKAGEIRPVAENLCRAESLRASPDGRRIALVCGEKADTPRGGEAWIIDVETGETTCLTPELMATVQSLEWLPDGSGLLLLIAEGLRSSLCTVTFDSADELVRVSESLPASVNMIRVSPAGGTLFAIAEDLGQGAELWRAELGTGQTTKLTQEAKSVAKLKLGKSRATRWCSTEAVDIDGIVTLPPGYKKGKRYPSILVIHGGPAGRFRKELGLLPRQLLAAEGYVVLTPNPRGSSGYGQDFVLANTADWGGGDFRDLMAGVDMLIERGVADPDRLGVYGGSYGGYMTAWTVTQTDRFKAAVCRCGLTNLYSFHGTTDITPSFLDLYMDASPYEEPDRYRAHSPMTHVKSVKTPTLFLHGAADVRVPIEQSHEMYWALKHFGVDAELVIYPREGHGIEEVPHQRDMYRRILEWFGEYV